MSHITSKIAKKHAADIHNLKVPGWGKRKRIIHGKGVERLVWYRL